MTASSGASQGRSRASTWTPRSREGTPTCTWQPQVPESATTGPYRRASSRYRGWSVRAASPGDPVARLLTPPGCTPAALRRRRRAAGAWSARGRDCAGWCTPGSRYLAECGSPAGLAPEPGKGQRARSAVRLGGRVPRGAGTRACRPIPVIGRGVGHHELQSAGVMACLKRANRCRVQSRYPGVRRPAPACSRPPSAAVRSLRRGTQRNRWPRSGSAGKDAGSAWGHGSGTITTGQRARRAQARATEPGASRRSHPRRRDPSTSRSPPHARMASSAAGRPEMTCCSTATSPPCMVIGTITSFTTIVTGRTDRDSSASRRPRDPPF